MIDEREIESDSSDEETESDDSEDERQRVALREMEERIGSIPERREEKLSKRKVRLGYSWLAFLLIFSLAPRRSS